MLVTISDFANERNEKRDTINRFIRLHPEINAETVMQGKDKCIDTESNAYKLLEKQYPLPNPIQVVNGVNPEEYQRVLNELNAKNNIIIQMQHELSDAKLKLVEETSQKLFLAEKNENKDKTIAEQNKSLETANNEILRLKNRNLINRIFNK